MRNASALFIGQSQISRSARNVTIQNNLLYKVDRNGVVSPVLFTDEDGNALQITVSGIFKNSRNYLTAWLNAGNNRYNVLIENSTGRVFILGNDREIVEINFSVSEVFGRQREIVYGSNMATAYLLDLNTLIAKPLNNPQFDPISGSIWLIDSYSGVFAIPYNNDNIIVNGGLILDLNGINPPQQWPEDNIYGYTIGWGNLNFSDGLPIFSRNGSFYSFKPVGKDLEVTRNGEHIETLTGSNASNDNDILKTTSYLKFAYDFDDLYIYRTGLLRVSMNQNGSLNYSYTPKDLSFLFEDGANYYFKNGILYCLSGNTFKKANPVSDTSYTTIYTSPNTVRKSWMIDEEIYFAAYQTATSIPTYLIPRGESEPILVSNSEMEIHRVIELSF